MSFPYTEEMMESVKKVEATRAARMAAEPRRMTAEEKDAVSPRGKSLRIFAEKLENYLKDKEG